MPNRQELEVIFKKHGYDDFKWIKTDDIIVAQWVRMKCTFGCGEFGRKATCPPHVPSVAECERLMREYSDAVIFHFSKVEPDREKRHEWSTKIDTGLVEVERSVFLAGYPKAFMMVQGSCHLCADCTLVRETCKEPEKARPTPEAMAIDVFSTVGKCGYPIKVVTHYKEEMNRYAFLLVE